MTHVLPSSPNWYAGRVIDISDDDKIIAFGARGDLNIFQLELATLPTTAKQGTGVTTKSTVTSNTISTCTDTVTKDNEDGFNGSNSCEEGVDSSICSTTTVRKNNDMPSSGSKQKEYSGIDDGAITVLHQDSMDKSSNITAAIETTDNSGQSSFQHGDSSNDDDVANLDNNNHSSLNEQVSNIPLASRTLSENSKMASTLSPTAPTKTYDSNNKSVRRSSGGRILRAYVNTDDCVLISSLNRIHKDKITAIRLLKRETAVVHNADAAHQSYSVFSGGDDGKVKHLIFSWEGDAFVRIPTVRSGRESEYTLPKNGKVRCLEICDEQLVIGDDKGNIILWQWEKTGIVNIINLANCAVLSLEFEKREHLLAVGMKNGVIVVYKPQSTQIVAKLKGHDDEIQSLQWRPPSLKEQHCIAGQLVSGSKDRTFKLWDLKAKQCVTTGRVPNTYTGGGGGNRNRVLWLSLVWLPTGQVITSSASGELFVWTLASKSCTHMSLVEEGSKGHSRMVFTLNLLNGGTKLLSTSMDRSIILWDITASSVENPASAKLSEIEAEGHFAGDDAEGLWARAEKPAEKDEMKRTCSGKVTMNMSSLGGYCFCIRASPVDPGRLAVGVGDDVIRVWNTNEGSGPYNITNLWQGVKGKITSVAWHPFIEGRLAFGTEDGKIGVFGGLNKKPPIISKRYHERTVYVVVWGPQLLTNDAVSSESMTPYSVGDGTVLIHNLSDAKPALDLNELLEEANGPLVPKIVRSEISWSHDFSQMYLGNNDGSVLVIRRSDLRCICSIEVAAKLVNAIRVQPHSDRCSTKLMAIGTNEHQIKVVDLSSIDASLGAMTAQLRMPADQRRISARNAAKEAAERVASILSRNIKMQGGQSGPVPVVGGHADICSKGENITQIQAQSDCRIQIAPDPPPGQSLAECQVSLNGTVDSIATAKDLINKTINEAGHSANGGMSSDPSGRSASSFTAANPLTDGLSDKGNPNNIPIGVNRTFSGGDGDNSTKELAAEPDDIGSKGENITQIQAQSGCRIQIAPDPPPGQSLAERQVSLNGTARSIAKAKDLINKTINEAGHSANGGMSSDPSAADQTLPIINEAALTLRHHDARLTDMCWSRLEPHKLLTVSYNGKAVVWDTTAGTVLAEYKYQKGHLLTCQWSLLDSDLVYTGSAGCSLHSWRPSQHVYKASVPTNVVSSAGSTATENADEGREDNATMDIQRAIEEKKRELSTSTSAKTDDMAESSSVTNEESALAVKDTAAVSSTKKVQNSRMTKKKMGKSLFPNMTAATRRIDDVNVDELIYLQKQMAAGLPVTSDEGKEHLGIFSVGKEEDLSNFLNKEKEVLFTQGNYDTAGYLCLWQGNVEESLQKAAAANSLTDTLVNSASMLGYTEWIKYCRLYAQQLKDEGLVHKAVTYLLYTHDVDTAILWLTNDNCYREAISIVRSRSPGDTNKIAALYKSWAYQLTKDANHDRAAKCLVSLGEPKTALSVLTQRTDTASAVKAVRFAMTSPDTADEMLRTCDRLTRQCLLSADYQLIESLCFPDSRLHPFYAWSVVTQAILPVLHTGYSIEISTLGIVPYISQLLSGHGVQLQHCSKQCSLSQSFLSTNQVQVGICERLLNIAVDVEQTSAAADQHLVDVFTMLLNLQESTSGQHSSLLTARLIQLFAFPGCDVADRLTGCSFESSQSLTSYSLYIPYLWSALTISMYDKGTLHTHPSSTAATCNGAEATDEGKDTATPTNLSVLVMSHTYQLAFSLCNSLFLPWIEPEPMKVFTEYLEKLDASVGSEESSLPEIDMFDLVAFVEQKNPEQRMNTKAVKAVLYMLLDMLRQLYIHMCYHGDKSHLPNLSPGRQLINEWIRLHATCYETGIAELAVAANASLDKAKNTAANDKVLSAEGADNKSADAANSSASISAETSKESAAATVQ